MTVAVLEVMSYSAGGIGRHVASLVSGLDGDELHLDIAAPPDGTVPMPKGVQPLEIPARPGPRFTRSVRQLEELLEGYSVAHAHGLRAGIAAVRAAGAGTRVIVTLHNLVRPETSGWVGALVGRRAETACMKGADRVFAVSEEMAAVLRRRAPVHAAKVELLRIGLPEPVALRPRAEVRSELGIGERDPLVLTVARLAPQKALDVLIDAIARLDSVNLAIVGGGPLEASLAEHARKRGTAERIRFLGWRDDVGEYLGAADVFALSSTWEARALAAQEAIMAGLPVVSSDVGGMSELITDGVSGRLVPPGDASALADAIAEVLGSPDRGRGLAERARLDLTAGYSNAAMLARVRAEYLGSTDA